ncbi:MAG: alkaline phosphatase, partial [Planctomycetota bacterium]
MTRLPHARRLLALGVAALLVATASPAAADDHAQTGSVIFIHPDGASAASWAVARALGPGPDGDLNWDKLSHIALYRGHMLNSLTGTSNGGATVHATGVKPMHDAFGKLAAGEDAPRILDAHGRYASVAIQAISVGIPVGLVQSGSAIEPGTAVFLAEADARADHEDIVVAMLESGAQVILGGGERHFLP